jgi:hypothetical protein
MLECDNAAQRSFKRIWDEVAAVANLYTMEGEVVEELRGKEERLGKRLG